MSQHLASGLPCDLCSSSDAVAEYETHYYCFSCETRTSKSLAAQRENKYKVKEVEDVELPICRARSPKNFPIKALKWLYRYRVFDELIKQYDLCYLPEENRVLIPNHGLVKEGPLLGYQTRSLSEFDHPKYLTKGKTSLALSRGPQTPYVVLVEDMLSCIRVGEVCSAVSLNGTSISDGDIYPLMNKFEFIVIWLDGDKPGQKAANKLQSRLCQYRNVSVISTELDPKEYTREQIKEFLCV